MRCGVEENEEPIMFMEDESYPIYDTDNEEDAEPTPKYDSDGDELVYGVEEVCHLALKVEKQQKNKGKTSTSKWTPTSKPTHTLVSQVIIPKSNPSFSFKEPIVLVEEGSCPVYDTDNGEVEDGDHEDKARYKQKAIEVVYDILQENEICEEESLGISMKFPNYVDSVRDLDQLYQSTSSISSVEHKDSDVDYQKDVFDMGIQKGDKGLVPVLESVVGLPISSAIHNARYISSSNPHTSTSNILHKAKYVKKLLFSDVDGKTLIATSTRRMKMHLSLCVDENLQHTLSFLEKIQARRRGLGKLGFKTIKVRGRVVTKKRNLMQEIQIWMLRVRMKMTKTRGRVFFQVGEDDTDRHHNTGPVERRPIDGNGSDGLSG